MRERRDREGAGGGRECGREGERESRERIILTDDFPITPALNRDLRSHTKDKHGKGDKDAEARGALYQQRRQQRLQHYKHLSVQTWRAPGIGGFSPFPGRMSFNESSIAAARAIETSLRRPTLLQQQRRNFQQQQQQQQLQRHRRFRSGSLPGNYHVAKTTHRNAPHHLPFVRGPGGVPLAVTPATMLPQATALLIPMTVPVGMPEHFSPQILAQSFAIASQAATTAAVTAATRTTAAAAAASAAGQWGRTSSCPDFAALSGAER